MSWRGAVALHSVLPASHCALQSSSSSLATVETAASSSIRDSEAACFVRSFATPLCVGRSALVLSPLCGAVQCRAARHLLQKQGIFGHNSTIIVFQSNQRPFFCASSTYLPLKEQDLGELVHKCAWQDFFWGRHRTRTIQRQQSTWEHRHQTNSP